MGGEIPWRYCFDIGILLWHYTAMKMVALLLLVASVACAAPRLTETEKLALTQRATEVWKGTDVTRYQRCADGTVYIWRNGTPLATAKRTSGGFLVIEKNGTLSTINL